MKTVMTKEQKEYIIDNYATMKVEDISKELGVEPIKIYKFACSKGIKKETTRSDARFTLEQKQFILENYQTMTTSEISNKTGLDCRTIREVARVMKVKKDREFCDSINISYKKRKYIIANCKNMTSSEIGEVLNISAYTVTKFCRIANLDLKPLDGFKVSKNLSIEDKRFIANNYSTMKNKEICELLNIDDRTLHNYASNCGLIKNIESCHNKIGYIDMLLEKRNRETYDVNNFINKEEEKMVNVLYKSKHGKYEVNQHYFDTIDNEFKAYWLGFLYADGCVRLTDSKGKQQNILEVGLASCDIGHVEKLKKSLQSSHLIKHRTHSNGKYHSDRLAIVSSNMCNSLNALGCIPNKSLKLEFPNEQQVPRHLIRHFIRGYFDGDGCIHINIEKRNVSVSFMGTEKFLTSLQDVLCSELDITRTKMQTREGNKALSVSWGNVYTIEKIYKYLYGDCNIYLERKLKKFDILYCLD